MKNLIRLFQFVDSALPVGGFVYSMGMESAIKSKLLQNESDLKQYLIAYTEQLISFEFPFMEAGYEAYSNLEQLNNISQTYCAMLMNPNLEKSALVLGKNWTRLLCSLYEKEELKFLKNYLDKHNIPLYFTIILGLFMAGLKMDKLELRVLFLYTSLRDQITALTRLGVVGPNGGQKLLTYILEIATQKSNDYQTVPYYKATKSAYLMEIIQLNHHKIYSKLFQN